MSAIAKTEYIPIHFGYIEAKRARARTLAVMLANCQRNWKRVPTREMFFLLWNVYLKQGYKLYRI